MERIMLFLPEIVQIIGMVTLTLIYLRLISKRIPVPTPLQGKALRYLIFFYIPAVCILTPAFQGLLFRAPLVILFPQLTVSSWAVLLLWSAALAFLHSPAASRCFAWVNKCLKRRVVNAKEEQQGLGHPISAFLIEALSICLGIICQSIWISVGVHAVFNLVPLFLGILPAMVIIIMALAGRVWRFLRRMALRCMR